jgi:hypothetical protein
VSTLAFLPGYLERLDAGDDILPLLAADFTFALLWATADGAHEFAGALEDFRGYLAQRDPAGQLHHVSHGVREGNVELATGWTTRYGEPLGTFMFAVELTEDGRMRRLYAARTESFAGIPF